MSIRINGFAVTPGTGTQPQCPAGSTWSPNEGRCVTFAPPTEYKPLPEPPQEPVPPSEPWTPSEPVDPYGPAPAPIASSKTPWLAIGIGAAIIGVILVTR